MARAPNRSRTRSSASVRRSARAHCASALRSFCIEERQLRSPLDLPVIQSGRAELSWSVDGPAVESNERTGCEDGGRSPTPTTCRGRAADAWRPPRDRCAEPSGAGAGIRDAACVAFGTTAQGVDIRHRATVHRRSHPARRKSIAPNTVAGPSAAPAKGRCHAPIHAVWQQKGQARAGDREGACQQSGRASEDLNLQVLIEIY